MTKKELCDKFNLSEGAVTKHFPRCQEQLFKKYGVKVEKVGRGEKAEYIISDIPATLDVRQSIEFIQDAHKDIIMDKQIFTDLIDWNFMVFMGIILCPMTTFRGTCKEFLNYVGIKKVNDINIQHLKQSLNELADRKIIMYAIDETNTEYFWAGIYRKVETELKVGIDMIQRCMRLQKENSMNSWVPLLKTWLGLQIISLEYKQETFTMNELESITGVNKKMLTKCKQILERDNLFQTSRAYITANQCIGQNINLNGLEHDYSNVIE